MTNLLNPDCTTPKTGTLPFAPGELDRSGLRLTRAEFSRFLGVSKQAVGEWVTAGKITLGADGRLDPRQAVSELLRNSDPARLRAKVLEPLSRDIGRLQKRVADLEAALANSEEDASFHEDVADEFLAQLTGLDRHLLDERNGLVLLPVDRVIDGITAWLKRVSEERASEDGTAAAVWITIFECVPGNGLDSLSIGAPDPTEEGWGAEVMGPTPDEIASLMHDDEQK